jgi:cytochrome d ubiquinol oxidase subunit I
MDLLLSLGGFIVFYTGLLIVEVFLMLKFIRLGPSALHTGRYFWEQSNSDNDSSGGSEGTAVVQQSRKDIA